MVSKWLVKLAIAIDGFFKIRSLTISRLGNFDLFDTGQKLISLRVNDIHNLYQPLNL